MRSHIISGILFALITMASVINPTFARHEHSGNHYHPANYGGYQYHHPYNGGGYYGNSYGYGNPHGYGYPAAYPVYNNYAYRGYAPYGEYGYYPNHTARNVAIGAGIGAAIGLLASHHGHRYD